MSSSRTQVRRRQVFYFPGYDPIHPRRYRELYRKESGVQAKISGYEIALSPKQSKSGYGWQVDAVIDGTPTTSDFQVLVWSDIVRDSMAQGIFQTYLQLVQTAWIYTASGALARMTRLRKGPVIAALYPVGFLTLQLLLSLGLGLVIWIAFIQGWDMLFRPDRELFTSASDVSIYLGLAIGAAASCLALRWFKSRDSRFFAYYLMHDYAYSARHRGANSPQIEERMAKFSEQIAQALKGNADEVLVVGHSSGAHLAVSCLADLIRAGQVAGNGPALSFLSLGQVVPMVSFLPQAYRLRADLAFLASTDKLSWVDVTAPGDGCSFALCDPVSVSGVAPDNKRWPLVLSAAFTQTLSPERWKELRWRFFRLHFQYLCAFDRPGDYDYFQITAGPATLGARYAGRSASKSRIETPTSGYTSVSP